MRTLIFSAALLAVALLPACSDSESSDTDTPVAYVIELDASSFGPGGVQPFFNLVENFEFTISMAEPLVAGASYGNADIVRVEYLVAGSLPDGSPSGFPRFALDRREGGREGSISSFDWIDQGSTLFFEVAADADLGDGLQLSDLEPDVDGLLFSFDGREFERTDVARYHPPQLLLFDDGSGLLQNSNNSSGGSGTLNPGTGLEVDVDFGEEYITDLAFDIDDVTLVTPAP